MDVFYDRQEADMRDDDATEIGGTEPTSEPQGGGTPPPEVPDAAARPTPNPAAGSQPPGPGLWQQIKRLFGR